MRAVLYLILYSAIGRWIYSETELSAPLVKPLLDKIVELTTIPTHDQWSTDSLEEVLKQAEVVTTAALAKSTNDKAVKVTQKKKVSALESLAILIKEHSSQTSEKPGV